MQQKYIRAKLTEEERQAFKTFLRKEHGNLTNTSNTLKLSKMAIGRIADTGRGFKHNLQKVRRILQQNEN